jgi:hypothetical protein
VETTSVISCAAPIVTSEPLTFIVDEVVEVVSVEPFVAPVTFATAADVVASSVSHA